jgi:hypothetical protein
MILCMLVSTVLRRFRFSLRTVFLFVTLLGVWLAWQTHVVRARIAFRREVLWSGPGNYYIYPPPPGVPFYRRWLGDEDVERIDVRHPDQLDRAKALFPEARLIMVAPQGRFRLERRRPALALPPR